jgi:hypothetical protein
MEFSNFTHRVLRNLNFDKYEEPHSNEKNLSSHAAYFKQLAFILSREN